MFTLWGLINDFQIFLLFFSCQYSCAVRAAFKVKKCLFVTLDHKTGSDNIWPRYNYLKICNLKVQKNLNIEKIAFKVVQMKFLAMHITNQQLSFDISTVRH